MRYVSTRNAHVEGTLSEAIAAGIAPDGGLYVAEQLPQGYLTIGSLPAASDLAALGQQMLKPFFAGDVLAAQLAEITREAFNFPAPTVPVAPGLDVLELFHGPTAAFKDFGARFLAAAVQRLESQSVAKRKLTILVATSGDTGGAVAAAFHGRPSVEVVVLYPRGLVSPRQEQQLTCWGGNVRSLRVRGTFDDCQRMVKEAFAQSAARTMRRLSSANSINIGRLLPQMVYYAAASVDVHRRTGRPASFIVPSGNLGNAMACVWARGLGLPIEQIVLAHNANRTVPDLFATGTWQPRPSVATLASAMDVGSPSNMERLRSFVPDLHQLRAAVSTTSIDDAQIRSRIEKDFARYGRIWCPHTAVAAQAYAQMTEAQRESGHWVLVATAHPAKFSEIVEPLVRQAIAVPAALEALLRLPQQVTEIDATLAALDEVLPA